MPFKKLQLTRIMIISIMLFGVVFCVLYVLAQRTGKPESHTLLNFTLIQVVLWALAIIEPLMSGGKKSRPEGVRGTGITLVAVQSALAAGYGAYWYARGFPWSWVGSALGLSTGGVLVLTGLRLGWSHVRRWFRQNRPR